MPHVEDSAVATAAWAGPARPGLIGEVRAGLLALACEHGMPPDRRRDLVVAVSEAVTNAVRHAYPDGDAGEVAVTATVDGARLTVRVADHGTGAASESLGFGTQIMRATSDRLVVGRSPDGPGTVVVMEFVIAGPGEPASRADEAMTVEAAADGPRQGVLHVSGRVSPLDVATLRRNLRTRLLQGRRVVLDLTETREVAVGHLVLMLLGLRAEARRRGRGDRRRRAAAHVHAPVGQRGARGHHRRVANGGRGDRVAGGARGLRIQPSGVAPPLATTAVRELDSADASFDWIAARRDGRKERVARTVSRLSPSPRAPSTRRGA